MKKVPKFALVLILIATMAVIVPSVFASFVPVSNQISDPCTGILPCDPIPPCTVNCPVEPCTVNCPIEPCTGIAMTACETPVPVVSTPAPAPQGEKDTISFNDSDLGVTLFVNHDENGAPVLQLYETQNETTNGNFAVTITQDDLTPYVDNLPTANVLLKSAGHIRVFVLTTGEIAVFVGPDSEGKMHIKIFNGIPWTHVTSLTIDPV